MTFRTLFSSFYSPLEKPLIEKVWKVSTRVLWTTCNFAFLRSLRAPPHDHVQKWSLFGSAFSIKRVHFQSLFRYLVGRQKVRDTSLSLPLVESSSRRRKSIKNFPKKVTNFLTFSIFVDQIQRAIDLNEMSRTFWRPTICWCCGCQCTCYWVSQSEFQWSDSNSNCKTQRFNSC